jgi:mannosyltransferase
VTAASPSPDDAAATAQGPSLPAQAPAPASGAPRQGLGILDGGALLLSAGLAAGLSFYELTIRSIWIDEATTWGTASQHGGSLWHWLVHDGGNMLGYYALMHVVVLLFGSSTFVLRLPSAIAFVATAPLTYLLVRRLFDRRAAVLASLAVPTSYSLIFWAQQARGYVPGVAFSTAGALALVVAVQDRRRWAWVAFVVCSALAAYMVLLTGLVVVAQLVALALLPRRMLELRRIAWSCLALLLAALPLAVAVIHRGSSQLDWIGQANLSDYQEIRRFMLSSSSSSFLALVMEIACAGGLVLAVWRLARHRRSPEAFATGLLVVWIVVPFGLLYAVSALLQPVMVDRYTLPLVPAVSMLAAVACSRLRPAPVAWAAALLLVVARTWVVPPSYGGDIEDWSGATSFVAANLQPHDCIAFFVADGFTAFSYYEQRLSRGPVPVPEPVLPVATYTADTPFVLDPETFPPSRLPAVVASCPRLWLVETHQAGEPPGPGVPSYQAVKYEALALLTRQLAGGYQAVNGHQFTGVFVALYERKP